jgi:trimeric autotransporter adhesin
MPRRGEGGVNIRIRISFFLLVLALVRAEGIAQIIATYAGPSLPVDGMSAITESIDLPSAVIADAAGGSYVASSSQNRVYRISATGILTIVAGNSYGTAGYGGDGGPATSALLNGPQGLALDRTGNLYIADTYNNRVRRVAPDGEINTVAGDGRPFFTPDGQAGRSLLNPGRLAISTTGDLYIVEHETDILRMASDGSFSYVFSAGFNFSSLNDGPIGFGSPAFPFIRGIAIDSAANLYIATGGRVVKRTPLGTFSTVAGDGDYTYGGDGGPAVAASFANPSDLAVDSRGTVYIADYGNCRIRRVSPDGVITTVAGDGVCDYGGDGGPAASAHLNYPGGIHVDSEDSLYIADTFNNRIRKVSAAGIMMTIGGDGTAGFSGDGRQATLARLSKPLGVAIDSEGNLYIADTGNNRVRMVSRTGVISTIAGTGNSGFSGDNGSAVAAQLSYPAGVAVDGGGNVYIADVGNSRIRKVTPRGIISTVAGTGTAGFSGDGGLATIAQLGFSSDSFFVGGPLPVGLAVDGAGNLYIADANNQRVRKVTSDGIISTVAGNGGDIAFVGARPESVGDGGPATDAQFARPAAIAVDAARNLYIADAFNSRIRKVTPNGVISTVVGSGEYGFDGDGGLATAAKLSSPVAVAIDREGNLYFSDIGVGGERIRKVLRDGSIITIAGNAISGYSGDGGPADMAQLSQPVALSADAFGNIYIADQQNNRIRKISKAVLSRAGSFPQIAFGSEWNTTITLTNASDIQVTARLAFYGDNGTPLALPLVFETSKTTNSFLDLTIPPSASVSVQTEARPFLTIGWAHVAASGALSGQAKLAQRSQNGQQSEVAFPLHIASRSVKVPYDNRTGFRTGIAVVNLSAVDSSIAVVVRDQTGSAIHSSTLTINGLGHASFFVETEFPDTVNREGTIDFINPAADVVALAFLFSPSGLTAIPNAK